MVSNFSSRFFSSLQPTCLLCGCSNYYDDKQEKRLFGICQFCKNCLPILDSFCDICASPLPVSSTACGECLKNPPFFNSTRCAVSYEAKIPDLILGLKTQHDNAICRLLSEMLISKLQYSPSFSIDCIIAVPMHWQRNLQKGNNHSYLLAKQIASNLNLALNTTLLKRLKPTPTQKSLSADQRRKNLQNSFFTTLPLHGKKIAIIDDVITTGSTLNEIAKTLKQGGAAEVHCWAVARTPKR